MRRARRNPYRRPDRRTKAAKAKGYPARSVYKLLEIDRRVQLFRPGQRVLDLGAAPGSWSAYAAERIGPAGQVLAVDLQPLQPPLAPNVRTIEGDVLEMDGNALAELAPYDVVLSDMAPKTSGDRGTDQWRSYELFRCAVEHSSALLANGGSFVGKLFMSGSFGEARDLLHARFKRVRAIRPAGTRKTSFEIFLVGLDARGAPGPDEGIGGEDG